MNFNMGDSIITPSATEPKDATEAETDDDDIAVKYSSMNLALECPDGLKFFADASNFFVNIDSEWVCVVQDLRVGTPVLQGHRLHFPPIKCIDKCATRMIGKHMESFSVEILDIKSRPILIVDRPLTPAYWFGWFCCCGDVGNRLLVSFPDGGKLGSVVQRFGFPTVHYDVRDVNDKTVIVIYPPLFGSLNGCRGRVTFKIKFTYLSQTYSNSTIKKMYGGCFYEVFTDSRNYVFDIPINLPFQMKALLFSSVFLLHAIYFERG